MGLLVISSEEEIRTIENRNDEQKPSSLLALYVYFYIYTLHKPILLKPYREKRKEKHIMTACAKIPFSYFPFFFFLFSVSPFREI